MKYLVLFISLLISHQSMALTDLNQPISIAQSDMSAADFLKEISKQSDIKFILGPKIRFSQKISMFLKDAPLKEVLDDFAKQQKVGWSAVGDDVIKISGKK